MTRSYKQPGALLPAKTTPHASAAEFFTAVREPFWQETTRIAIQRGFRKDVIITTADTGSRNARELYRSGLLSEGILSGSPRRFF
jgi:hypothetical protein